MSSHQSAKMKSADWLTPLDRGRLGIVTAEAESKLEAFLGRRHAG